MEILDDPDSPNVIITFEVPGVKSTDLSVSLKQGVLLILGERQPRYRPSRQRHHSVRRQAHADARDVDSTVASRAYDYEAHVTLFPIKELRYGQFRRAIRLPDGADTSRTSASLSDGLLTVTWPRQTLEQKQLDETAAPTTQSAASQPSNRGISIVRTELH
ncbi:HSP20-like chaperone [Mycena vitilis]|nr:HSP20-like chaperone [Mycena vitilis]KAJ6489278.1 HSP20-like chaperone [Mycena vitilis]